MRGGIVFSVGFDFYDLANQCFATMDAYEVFTEKVFGDLEGGAKVKTPGELLHGLTGRGIRKDLPRRTQRHEEQALNGRATPGFFPNHLCLRAPACVPKGTSAGMFVAKKVSLSYFSLA